MARLWLMRGIVVAGPDEHERPGVVELVEAPTRPRPRSRSTRRRSCTARRPAGPSAPASARRVRSRAAAPTASARSRRTGAGSETVMSVDAARAQHGGRQQADRAAAGDEHAVARGRRPTRFTVWIAIAVGSVSAAARVESASGTRSSARRGHDLVAAERAAVKSRRSGGSRRRHTDERPRRHARHSPQPGVGFCTTRAPTSQPRDAGAERGDRARPLVAEDAAGARVALEHEVQVGAADAAVRHLDEHLVGGQRRARRARAPRSRRRRRTPQPASDEAPRADSRSRAVTWSACGTGADPEARSVERSHTGERGPQVAAA